MPRAHKTAITKVDYYLRDSNQKASSSALIYFGNGFTFFVLPPRHCVKNLKSADDSEDSAIHPCGLLCALYLIKPD